MTWEAAPTPVSSWQHHPKSRANGCVKATAANGLRWGRQVLASGSLRRNWEEVWGHIWGWGAEQGFHPLPSPGAVPQKLLELAEVVLSGLCPHPSFLGTEPAPHSPSSKQNLPGQRGANSVPVVGTMAFSTSSRVRASRKDRPPTRLGPQEGRLSERLTGRGREAGVNLLPI